MVRYTLNKPDCFKQVANDDNFRYFKLLYEDEIYGYAMLDFRFKPYCGLHLEICKWSPQIFKELTRKDWNFAKNVIRSLDCNQVVLTKKGSLGDQSSYMKLIKACGFPEPVVFTQSIQEI